MSNAHVEVQWGWGLRGKQYLKNIFVGYGQLTKEGLAKLFKAQGECCAICGCKLAWPLENKDRWGFPFEIDHLHVAGERRCVSQDHIRGLLCKPCNMQLRTSKDRPTELKAQAYLAKYAARHEPARITRP